MSKSRKTALDRIVDGFKNNKFIALLLVVFIVLIGLGNLTTALDNILSIFKDDEEVASQATPDGRYLLRYKYYVFEGSTLLKKIVSGDGYSRESGFEQFPYWQQNSVYALLEEIDRKYFSRVVEAYANNDASRKLIFSREGSEGEAKSFVYDAESSYRESFV